jgi:hypothetical protein
MPNGTLLLLKIGSFIGPYSSVQFLVRLQDAHLEEETPDDPDLAERVSPGLPRYV